MTTPARPAPSVSGILEQLDELESLMRRMLTVPVEPDEKEAPPPKVAPATSPEVRASAKSNFPSVQEPAAVNEEPKAAVPPLRDPVRISPAPKPQPVKVTEAPAKAAWITGASRTEPALKPIVTATPRPGILRRGLRRVDGAFHALTRPWGAFGRWLDDDPGRATLGMLGILLVLGACSWGAWDWWSARDTMSSDPANLAPKRVGR